MNQVILEVKKDDIAFLKSYLEDIKMTDNSLYRDVCEAIKTEIKEN